MALKSLRPTPPPSPVEPAPPTSAKQRKLTVLVSATGWRQLKEFALEEGTTLQAFLLDAAAEKMARKGITLVP